MSDFPAKDVEIFAAAIELPPAERAAYLNRACRGELDLRQRVEALLREHDGLGDFLEKPPSRGIIEGNAGAAVGEKPADRIGRYRLVKQLGEGGCGVVFLAEQEKPVKRQVALKLIKPGMDTRSVIARFEAERQVLALMDHPNIAKVFDAGETESGRPYFVMELVRGIRITDYCDKHSLATEDRLKLIVQVCQAIQHAHQKGIIHRDIKPSNILVTQSQQGAAVPMVIDFGVAKATTNMRLSDATVFTAVEMLIGTPAYMSPEQAALKSADVDTRTDIYSLGVLLYELLTSTTPFETREILKAGIDEVRRVIREEEPVRPSTRLTTMTAADLVSVSKHHGTEAPRLIRQMRGELDWIVMKALEKDRSRRFQTADSLANDILRYLKAEPISARPPSRVYQFRKLVARHKLEFTALGIVIAALVAALSISTWSLVKERKARQKALTEAARSKEVMDLVKRMLGGADPAVSAGFDTFLLRLILDRTVEDMEQHRLTNQPAVEADLKVFIGGVYGSVRNWEKQESLMLSAVDLYRRSGSGDEQKIADALAAATNAHLMLARLKQENPERFVTWPADEAFSRYELALRRPSVVMHGLDDPHYDEWLQILARILAKKGKMEEAADDFRELLEYRRKHLGDKDSRVTETVTELAKVLTVSQNDGQFERLARDFPEAWMTRSDDLARRRQWPEALAAAARLVEVRPDDHRGYHLMAPLLVQTGDRNAYEELCAKITARFAGSTNPFTADRMAKDCLILARPGADLRVPGELAEIAVTRGRGDAVPFFQCCKALAEYRQGHWDNATDWATKAAENRAPFSRAEAYAILAMAQYQSKRAEAAGVWLAKCDEIVETQFSKLEDKDLGGDWRDWIIAHALRSEAKRMIEDGSSTAARPAKQPP